MKKLNLLFSMLFAFYLVNSQEISLKGIVVSVEDPAISEKVSDYKTYSLDLSNIKLLNTIELNLQLGEDYSWNLHLFKNDLRSEGYKSFLETDTGLVQCFDEVRTYKGA